MTPVCCRHRQHHSMKIVMSGGICSTKRENNDKSSDLLEELDGRFIQQKVERSKKVGSIQHNNDPHQDIVNHSAHSRSLKVLSCVRLELMERERERENGHVQKFKIQLTLPKSNPLGLKKSLRLRENSTYVG